MLGIIELLKLRGLPTDERIKIVRHQDKRWDVEGLLLSGHLETYQAYQKKIFDCDFVVSTVGQPRSRARFIGVYQVHGQRPATEVPPPPDFPCEGMIHLGDLFYDLRKVAGFGDLEERVIIDWGRAALAWHQRLTATNDKAVIEVLPTGYTREFPGYLDFMLSFAELKRIVDFPEANRTWRDALAQVSGVYLIMDHGTGAQYIGSAAGPGGIMARWTDYVRTSGHGGNKKLKELLLTDPTASQRFHFTVLRTLQKTSTVPEVVAVEQRYKQILGTRAFGLTLN